MTDPTIPESIFADAWVAYVATPTMRDHNGCMNDKGAVQAAVRAALSCAHRLSGEGADVRAVRIENHNLRKELVEWKERADDQDNMGSRAIKAEANLAAARARADTLCDERNNAWRERAAERDGRIAMERQRDASEGLRISAVVDRAKLEAQLAAARTEISNAKASGNWRTDKELGDFQNAVRDILVKAAGDQGYRIDGGGCDSGDWMDLTLDEVGQGAAIICEDRDDADLACKSAEKQLAAAQATIAGQGERVRELEEERVSAGKRVRAQEKDIREMTAALIGAGFTHCGDSDGFIPPIKMAPRKPLSLSVQRYNTRDFSMRPESEGHWVSYSDLLAWERGEPTAPESAGKAPTPNPIPIHQVALIELSGADFPADQKNAIAQAIVTVVQTEMLRQRDRG